MLKNIKRTNINRWLNRLEPTLLVAFDIKTKAGYWIWVDHSLVDLSKSNESFTVKIPIINKLSENSWFAISLFVKKTHILTYSKLPLSEPEDDETSQNAWFLMQKGEYELATHFYKKLIQDQTATANDLHNLAVCFYSQYDYEKALLYINQALEAKVEYDFKYVKASILTEMAATSDDKMIASEAVEIFRELTNERTDSQLYYNYANSLHQLGDYSNALEQFRKSLTQNPNNHEVWNNYGNSLKKLERLDEAIDAYDRALKLNPKLSQALFHKGEVFMMKEDPEAAIHFFLASYESSRDEIKPFRYLEFHLAHAYEMNEDLKKALIWNKKGLALYPGDDYYLNQLARVYTSGWRESLFELQEVLTFLYSYLSNKHHQPNRHFIAAEVVAIELSLNDNLELLWPFIQREFAIYHNLKPSILTRYEIDIQDFLESLKYFGLFEKFRISNPNDRHFIFISELSLNLSFDEVSDHMDILFLLSFANLYKFLDQHKRSKSLSDYVKLNFTAPYQYLNKLYPALALFLYEGTIRSGKADLVAGFIADFISKSAISELMRQTFFIAGLMELNGQPKFLQDENIQQEWLLRFFYDASTVIYKNKKD